MEAGPVQSAVFGEEMHNCQLLLASHQVRLHASCNVQVHLRAGSNPIIEGCNRIGFGPLSTLQYQGFDGFCESAELQAGGLHWERVEDFSNPGSEIKKNW